MPARNLSPQTRRGYTYDLTEWVATTAPSSPVAALSTDAISHYLSGLDDRGLKGSTRHRKVAAIKTFLRYLEREGALPVDFSSRITWPEVQRDEPRALSQPEYTALLREAGHHPRDAAILELLLQTGIRLAELTALTVEDVSLPATQPRPDQRLRAAPGATQGPTAAGADPQLQGLPGAQGVPTGAIRGCDAGAVPDQVRRADQRPVSAEADEEVRDRCRRPLGAC